MFVKKFKDISKENVNIAGGKGASLGEMYSSNIPVPNGFVVLSNAFNEFIKKTGLNNEIKSELDKVNIDNVETVEKTSKKIISAILQKEFPEEFKQSINKEFNELNTKFVAVRSSATSEDSDDAAWAGQLDTFLNTKKENLLENIKKCWASLFTPRAIFYRFEKELDKTDVSVAVVVQKMVESQISGIAFSTHPITEDHNQILIEAGVGLGEAIVSGQITPDNYVIRKKDLEIETKNISKQNKALFRGENGGVKWVDIKEHSQKLSDELILKLSKIIINIEKHYEFPCDIEWAYENEELYITQSRPITTLSSTNKDLKKKEINLYKGQETVKEFLEEIKDHKIIQCMDTNVFPETISGWQRLQFVKKQYNTKSSLPFFILMEKNKSVAYYQETIWDEIEKSFTKSYFEKTAIAKEAIEQFYSDVKTMNNLYEKYSKKFISEKTLLELQEVMPQLSNLMELKLFSSTTKEFCAQFITDLNDDELDEIWKKGSEPTHESFLIRQKRIIYNKILQDVPLDKLAEETQYFYAGYSQVLNLEETKTKLNEEYTITKEQARIELKKLDIQNKHPEFQNWYTTLSSKKKKVVDFIQLMIKLRDLRKDLLPKGITIFHRIIKQHILDPLSIPEKTLQFITYEELLQPLSYFEKHKEELVNRINGKAFYINNEGEIKINDIDFEEAKNELDTYMDHQLEENKNIQGKPASPGTVRGMVRVIKNIKEEIQTFQEGEILVTGMTRVEHMPLIIKSSAIVTDEGGITSHAAIISRELKKPCIVGTQNATRVLHTGDFVEVDANKGVVKILETKEIPKYSQILHHHFPLIMAELTDYGESIRELEWADEKFEFNPYCVFEIKDEYLYYLYDMKGVEWKIKQAGKFDKEIMKKKVLEGYNKIKETILNEKALDKEEFIKFIEHSKEFWTWWELMWWMIEYYDKNNQPIEDLIAVRKETEYIAPGFAGTIRNSLKKIFPGKEELIDGISLQDLNKGLPNNEVLRKRINHTIYTNGRFYDSKEEVEKEHNIKFVDENLKHNGELTGQIAYKGQVKGIVKIIEKRKDIIKFNEGNILVASTTTPDLLPAMKIAGAILSEHGGAISHATITSRELKKPCIVGIRGLTKILKNGDFVEVNANEGIVKIIEKEKTAKPKSAIVDKFTEIIGNNKIINQNGEVYLLTIIFNWFGKGDRFIEFDNYPIIMSRENKVLKTYFDETKYEIIAKTTFINYLKNQKIKELVEFDIKEIASKINKLYEEYFITNKTKEEKLLEIFTKAHEYLIESTSKTIFSENFDKRIASECLKENGLSAELNKVIKYSEKNIFESFENRFNRKIIENINNKAELTKMQFAFSDYTYIPSFEQLDKTISEINLENVKSNLLESEKRINANKLQIEVISKDLSALDKAILQYFEWIAYMRDYRKEYLHKCQVLMFNTTRDLYKLWGVDINLATETLAEEICEGKEKLLSNLEKIKNRKNGFVILCETENRLIEEQENVSESIKKLDKLVYGENIEIKELRGETGAKGKYIGKVRVIKEKSEFNQFEEGEVLVAGMTRPEFVPLMKKSGAIVTDEGGLTCHAAIVSRELKIPCVIGTKYATRSLKTGDLVEVDANKGIVKIVEQTTTKEEKLVKKFKEYFSDKEFTKHEGSFSPLVWGSAASSIESPLYKKYYPTRHFGPVIFLSKDKEAIGFFDFASYVGCAEEGLQRYLKEQFSEFEDFKVIANEIKKYYKKYSPKDIKKLSNEEIYNLLQSLISKMQDLQIITLFCEALYEDIVKKYYEELHEEEETTIEEFFKMASLVFFDSFFGQLDSTLINFDEENVYDIQWVFSDYMGTCKIEDVKEKLKKLIESKGGLEKIRTEREELKKESEANKKQIDKYKEQLGTNLLKLFEFTQETIKTRDLRKKDLFYAITLISNFGREMLRRKNIPEELYYYINHNDIKSGKYLETDYQEILEKRKKGNLNYYDEEFFEETNVNYYKVKKEIFEYMDRNKGTEIKGNPAQKGIAKGPAKIILNQSQFGEFEEGDVLVTSMTRPEFIPLMKKASAIITDEGGLTCHAAIISRELKKPCIIGTQNASRLIKNGDFVEVNANEGIVKILEKTNKKKLTEHIMLKNTPAYPFYFLNESLTKGVKIVLDDNVEKTIMEFENNNFKGYINIDKVNELGKKILDKIIQDETFYILVEKKVFEKAEKLMAFCKNVPKNLSLLTNEEISDLFEKYTLILNETRNWGMIPPLLEGSQAFLTDEIKGQFKKHLQSIGKEENLENYYAILSSSKDKSEIQTEELKRLEMINKINQDHLSIFEKDTEKILDELERNYPEILDVIRNHKKEFSWITYGFSGNVMKDSNIIELIKSSLKQKESIKEQISKINNQFQTIESQKEKLIEKLQIPNNLKYLFNVSSRFMFLKDWRKGIYQKSYVAMDPVIEEISKRMNISNLECRYLTRLEIKEALINNEDFSEKTKKRISYCVAIVKNGETKIYEGNEAKEIIKRETQKKEIVDKTIKQFKGSVAYPGKIKGIAKIINTIDDMSKMEEGNVLVSATTNPDLILSMKKASGFITDFGGITSHAAIVSREMKKPCVVGTKYATSIIQDGDLIELDANKGIITILEKK